MKIIATAAVAALTMATPAKADWLAMAGDFLGNWATASGSSEYAARQGAKNYCEREFGPPCGATISVQSHWYISAVFCDNGYDSEIFLAASPQGWDRSDYLAYDKATGARTPFYRSDCRVVGQE